jgi:phytoene dehydrogenase-like protein
MPANKYDAIVVGAGHNGLVTASYLARAGLRVLVLERRDVVGGLCVTEEVFPGFRTNPASNSCHNLEPRVVADMELEKHGLRFAYPTPNSFMAFPDGRLFVGWHDKNRFAEQIETYQKGDAAAYAETIDELNELAETLDVSFFEAPPTLAELTRKLETPHQQDVFRKVMFGSATELLSERIKSPEIRATLGIVAVSANFTGPGIPGSAYMLFHRPLYRGSRAVRTGPKFQTLGAGNRTPIGGMGEITQAMARSIVASGAAIRTNAGVSSIQCKGGRAYGVVLETGEVLDASIVISGLNPKSTLLHLVGESELPSEMRSQVQHSPMQGSVFKVNLALDALPQFRGATSAAENEMLSLCGFRTGPSLAAMDECYFEARRGRWSSEPMIWGLMPSTTDPSMAPAGKHVMSLSVFHAPYELAEGSWDVEKERCGKHIIDVLADYIPNLKDIILDYKFSSPKDLEAKFGLTEGNPAHGDMTPSKMFSMRPFPGCSAYRTPIAGLYLCSVGNWPANYVSGIPGHNAAKAVLSDLANTTALSRASDLASGGGVYDPLDHGIN